MDKSNELANKKIVYEAQKLARLIIVEGMQPKNTIKESSKNLTHEESIMFSYIFANHCSQYCVEQLSNSKDPEAILHAVMLVYGQSVIQLPDSVFGYALAILKNSINSSLPSLTEWIEGRKDLNPEAAFKIAQAINAAPECTENKRILINEFLLENNS